MQKRVWMSAAAVVVLMSSALAASPVGKWKGKVSVSAPPMPANATDAQKKQVEQAMAMVKAMVINMDVKSNKTYVVTVTGGPQQPKPESGTWAQKGSAVIFTSPKSKQGQKMTLSADGKKMTVTMGAGPQAATVTFTKS